MFDLASSRPQKPVVVISDTHFGEDMATLGATTHDVTRRAPAAATLAYLFRALEQLGPLDEIVLLGDIWEMWGAPFALARREAAPFLARLSSLPVERITYVPGNHDYHLLIQHIEQDQTAYLRRGEQPPRRYRPDYTYTDSFLVGLVGPQVRDRFVVKYPDYVRTVGGRRVVFHHGHHLATLKGGDLFASFPMLILKRLEGVGLSTLTREDLERGISIFYEMVYAGSLGDRTPDRLQAYWQQVQGWKTWWGWTLLARIRDLLRSSSSMRERGTPEVDVERFADSAHWLLRLMAAEAGPDFVAPEILVFGHSHRSGLASVALPSGETLHLLNSGCWFVEPHKRNTDHVNTLAILDAEHAGVYKLDGDRLVLREAIPLTRPEVAQAWP